MKTHKGLKKRVKITARGKVRFKRSFGSHLMSDKTGKQVRRQRKPCFLSGVMAARIRRALGA